MKYTLLVGLMALLSLVQPAPAQAQQSTAMQVENLLVQVWPEYDRPETLVIYRVELASAVALPAEVSFSLPGHIDTLHAVAVAEEDGLFELDPALYELRPEGEITRLNISSPARRFQFEYYDPLILTRQNQNRELAFQFTSPYHIQAAEFQVQEPVQSQDFTLVPSPTTNFVGNNGLRYNVVEVANLAPEETLTLAATYSRDTDRLSTQSLAQPPQAAPTTTGLWDKNLGYALLGVGVVLLLGTAAYYWWGTRPARQPARARQRRKQAARGYCYRCGAALRPDANFCHACGAERRPG